MKGIDISEGSGKVDFRELKGEGYEFVICRAGYGSDASQVDKRFHEYVKGALDAGLHVGAYWFIYARTLDEAEANGKAFLDVVGYWPSRLDMPLFIDYEYDSTRYYEQETGIKESRDTATEYIRRAADVVERAGYYTGVYLNPDYIKNHVDMNRLRQYTLWLAQWQVSEPSYQCGIWQKSGDTKISQATGGVDLNECFTDYPTVIRRVGLNGFKPEPAPQATGLTEETKSGDRWELITTSDNIVIKLGGKTNVT